MKEDQSFYCAPCERRHPNEQKAKDRHPSGGYCCQGWIDRRNAGDKEAVKRVPDEIDAPVNYEHGYCKCGNIDDLVDGKCHECIDKSEARKNKAVKRKPESACSPADIVKRQPVVDEACRKLKASGRIM